MDSVIEQLLNHLSMYMQQELDFPIDTQRFGTDAEFASQVLALAEELRHGETRSLVTQIRNRQLQLLALHGGSSQTSSTAQVIPGDQDTDASQHKPA